MYWLDPLAWCHRALVQNELNTDTYRESTLGGQAAGDTLMDTFDIRTDRVFTWTAVFYVLFWYGLWLGLGSLALYKLRPSGSVGTQRHEHRFGVLMYITEREREREKQGKSGSFSLKLLL